MHLPNVNGKHCYTECRNGSNVSMAVMALAWGVITGGLRETGPTCNR